MTNDAGKPLQNAESCLVLLRQVMHCLDETLVQRFPDHADKLGLASAHLQHAIDLLDQTKTP